METQHNWMIIENGCIKMVNHLKWSFTWSADSTGPVQCTNTPREASCRLTTGQYTII